MRATFPAWMLLGAALAAGAQACGQRFVPTHGDESFPLRGAHVAVSCEGCHVGAAEPSRACEGCHEDDRPAVHDQGPCGACHTEDGWMQVNHDFFPLQDAHDVSCESCHVGGVYTGLSTACSSCHEGDRPAGHHDGQDCGSCHQPTFWADAEFDHEEFFPTPHHGVSACSDCHIGGDTSDFSCTDCHEHSASHTNNEHDEVGGYQYDSDACYECHPDGREHD